MKLALSESISLILALPAHRSSSEGHRKLGEKSLDFLFGYQDLAVDDTEKAFNRAMICSILSSVRAFSVERDRIKNKWNAIEAIKKRRERYVDVLRNLSPLEKGNYWSKSISLIIAMGFAIKLPLAEIDIQSGVWALIFILIGLEVLSKVLESGLAAFFEKGLPIEKNEKWQDESMERYKVIIDKFIDEAIEHYKYYYPNESSLYGYELAQKESVTELKQNLIKRHLYFMQAKV